MKFHLRLFPFPTLIPMFNIQAGECRVGVDLCTFINKDARVTAREQCKFPALALHEHETFLSSQLSQVQSNTIAVHSNVS